MKLRPRHLFATITTWILLALVTFNSSDAQVGFALNDGSLGDQTNIELSNCQPCESGTPFQYLDGLDQPGRTFTAFFGLDGSKQPQDFGTNANLGGIGQFNLSAPLLPGAGIGFQIGNTTSFSGNAVQVFELLGESKDRFQNFTTVGVFQRRPSGIAWGAAYDFLFQESYDSFQLGQLRFAASLDLGPDREIGVTLNIADQSDQGMFGNTPVVLDPIEQIRIHIRRQWETGVQTTFWVGVADRHSEENAVTGTLPPKNNQVLFGADIFAPLNQWMAIYGETNLMMPADTGVVDAFLGVQIAPQGIVRAHSRNNRFRPLFSVASSPNFSVDLNRQ